MDTRIRVSYLLLTQSGHRLSILRIGSPAGSASYFFIIIVIRNETTAAARWALPLIVRTLFNDAIAVAVWTGFGFHVRLPVVTFASPNPPSPRRNSNRSPTRAQFNVRLWCGVRPHPSRIEVDAAMARCRRQCSDVNTVVLVFSSVPNRHNQSGRAGRCFVHMCRIAVSSNRHSVEF